MNLSSENDVDFSAAVCNHSPFSFSNYYFFTSLFIAIEPDSVIIWTM